MLELLELSDYNRVIHNKLLIFLKDIRIIEYLLECNINELLKIIPYDERLIWSICRMKDIDRYFMIDRLIDKVEKNDMNSNVIQTYEVCLSEKIIYEVRTKNYMELMQSDYMACCILYWIMKYMYIYSKKISGNMLEFEQYKNNYVIMICKILKNNNIMENERNTLRAILESEEFIARV